MSEGARDARARQEVQALWRDSEVVPRILSQHLQASPPECATNEQATFSDVTNGLWCKAVQHCRVTALLLNSGVFSSAVVVHRAAYETMATLGYIVNRDTQEAIEAALLHRAYSFLETVKWFPGQLSAAAEASRVLSMMPAATVDKAGRHHKKGKGPFGLSIGRTAEAAGIEGHQGNYAVLSWEPHARFAGGEHGEINEAGLRVSRYGEQVQPEWTEALANQARRLLHGTYGRLAWMWLGKIPPLPTTDPHGGFQRASG